MGIFEVAITYSYEGDIYMADAIRVEAVNDVAAEALALNKFSLDHIYDDIREVKIEEIPIGI